MNFHYMFCIELLMFIELKFIELLKFILAGKSAHYSPSSLQQPAMLHNLWLLGIHLRVAARPAE